MADNGQLIADFESEFRRYKAVAEEAMAQLPDDALNWIPYEDGNSVAMIVRHISGNLASRFTDFLASDGEKSWRHRDQEFVSAAYDRDEVHQRWEHGWYILEDQLGKLNDADLSKQVTIRGRPHSVHEALCRALAHIAYHAGQIVLIARTYRGADWEWISIPKAPPDETVTRPDRGDDDRP